MKLHFTSNWLRGHIDSDPDIECEAGLPLRDAIPLEQFVQESDTQESPTTAQERNSLALHVLMHQVRRRDRLTVVQLADRILVEVTELKKIENDPNFIPRPRTLYKIAEYLKVPATAVQSLTADAMVSNENVSEEALRFAASSENLTALTKTERYGLNNFVKFLAKLDKGK